MRERIKSETQKPILPLNSDSSLKPDSHVFSKSFLIILLAIVMKTWQPLAVGLSKNADSSYSFNKTSMVMLVELLKLLFCSCAFAVHFLSSPLNSREQLYNLSFVESLHFLIPSLLYTVSNTLVYVGISYINPALFHVFGNIRILTSSVTYRLFMKKPLSDLQWLALILLTTGAVLATPSEKIIVKENENNTLGLIAAALMCLSSSIASVYIEANYKKTAQLSIFFQNMVLYAYGILVNFIWIFFTDLEFVSKNGIFYGFDKFAFHVLISQAAMGISLSFIFKYLDNITYVISFTVSMFISAIFSVFLFEFVFTLQFSCALIVVSVSIYHYYRVQILGKFEIDPKSANF